MKSPRTSRTSSSSQAAIRALIGFGIVLRGGGGRQRLPGEPYFFDDDDRQWHIVCSIEGMACYDDVMDRYTRFLPKCDKHRRRTKHCTDLNCPRCF